MDLYVGHQLTRRQVQVTVTEKYSLAEPVPIEFSFPRHPESVGLCRMTPKCEACMESHAHYLGHIGAEAHTFKQIHKGSKRPLKAGFLFQYKNTIVCIKYIANSCTSRPKPSIPSDPRSTASSVTTTAVTQYRRTASSLVYQDESNNWYIYHDIYIYLGGKLKKKLINLWYKLLIQQSSYEKNTL